MNIQLKQTINKAFGVDIDNRTRAGNHAIARQLYCYIRYKTTVLSLKAIGKEVNRNHATVIHSKSVMEGILQNPKDRHYFQCKRIFNMFSEAYEIPIIDTAKDDLIEKLIQEVIMLKEEIRQLKSGKPTILDHLKALPEHVQENVMFRLNSIVKMESSKVMKYNQSVKIIN
jgi:hypothetical protein